MSGRRHGSNPGGEGGGYYANYGWQQGRDDVQSGQTWHGERANRSGDQFVGYDQPGYGYGYGCEYPQHAHYAQPTSRHWQGPGQPWQPSAPPDTHAGFERYGDVHGPRGSWQGSSWTSDGGHSWGHHVQPSYNYGFDAHEPQSSRHRPRFYGGGRQMQSHSGDRTALRQYSSLSNAKRGRDESLESHNDRSFNRREPRAPDFQTGEANTPTSSAKLKVRAQPKIRYLRQTLQEPEQYPLDTPLPRPLPLLVLDLNGTLVYRTSRTAERSKKPVLRPYLSNFLEYCLALHLEQEKQAERMSEWDEWDENQKTMTQQQRPAALSNEVKSDSDRGDSISLSARDADEAKPEQSSKPRHGSFFWSKQNEEPTPHEKATFRLLIWSSAQPHNVESMARAFLHPVQAEQLLRVYARDTLVIDELYRHKSQSVKDLEIVWAALNNSEKHDPKAFQRAEARIKAQGRLVDMEEAEEKSDTSVRDDIEALWADLMSKPNKSAESATDSGYVDGVGYGPHNTLLLDDSLHKARLQPYNHIFLPEFDAERARIASEYQKAEVERTSGAESDAIGKENTEREMPDDVLLQVIGVLEHARYQANVSSWIRFGGLGNFGNMNAQHDGRFEDSKPWHMLKAGLSQRQRLKPPQAKELKSNWAKCFLEPKDTRPEEERLRSPPALGRYLHMRTPAFWAEEGKKALLKLGIEPKMFL